jgi:plastocyanin
MMTRNALLASGLLVAATLVGFGCTDNSGNGPGNPGTAGSGGTTGAGGSAGTTGAGGSSANFMAVPPCDVESAYMTGTTISFPASPTDFSYSPKCLKVSAGATVTFSGDFTLHPLLPSTHRGTLTGSPITSTATGTTASFDFPTAGYYAYFCGVHGPSDGAAGMVGVVWVQ